MHVLAEYLFLRVLNQPPVVCKDWGATFGKDSPTLETPVTHAPSAHQDIRERRQVQIRYVRADLERADPCEELFAQLMDVHKARLMAPIDANKLPHGERAVPGLLRSRI